MDNRELIRKEFVKQVLEEEGRELHKNQSAAISKLLHFHSNRLHDERPYSATQTGDMDGMFSMSIPIYGRFLDIKPKNRKSTGGKYGKWKKQRRTKAYPIYNRFVFGHYYTIAYKLMYGFTNDVADTIKKQFQQQ
jgi:hypothetical protein